MLLSTGRAGVSNTRRSVILVSFPPPFITGENSNSWLLDAAAELWDSWLNDPLAKTTVQRYDIVFAFKINDIFHLVFVEEDFTTF